IARRRPMHTMRHVLLLTLLLSGRALAEPPNTLTLENQSGEDALVKVGGPLSVEVAVPTGASRTVHVAAGEYVLLVRYGHEAENYRYVTGDPFMVEQTAIGYSVITIPLHTVVDGNYDIAPVSAADFERAGS